MSTLQAVVFDLDGLLVDSEPVQMAAWQRFLGGYGHQLTSELLGQMFGLRIWDSAQLVIDAFGLALTVEEVVTERDDIFFDALKSGLHPMPGALELVRDLDRRGLPLGLATSGHRRYVDIVLGQLGLAGAFRIEVTGEQVALGKPAPDIYLAAATSLGFSPQECLALEDAPLGILAAKAAGMCCLAVPNESTGNLPGFERADAILSSLEQVIPWLEQAELIAVDA